jgi:hypothetical protein
MLPVHINNYTYRNNPPEKFSQSASTVELFTASFHPIPCQYRRITKRRHSVIIKVPFSWLKHGNRSKLQSWTTDANYQASLNLEHEQIIHF